ncbi:N-acetylmuramoyl-L-alanine amidase [Streptomyces sp. NPDC002088]|uniref:peptidoglycan recognition protein family protein n=1 Tax=Streptomyces sp. NPDC002088 TaxID=3154665 RepID=UPI003327DE76
MSRIVGMRGLLASSIGVTCAAALALPLIPPAVAAAGGASASPTPTVEAAAPATARAAEPDLPGSTQSLPLAPLTRDRDGSATLTPGTGTAEQGLPRRDVRHFSLVGVVWDDPDTELHGRVEVRTRAAGTGTWSGWQGVETHNGDHGADPDTPERTSGHVRGATAPLWVGDSDGVEVRVDAEPGTGGPSRVEETGRGPRTVTAPGAPLPSGLRLELVDPGRADSGLTAPGARPGRLHAPVAAPRTGAVSARFPPPGADGELTAEAAAVSATNADLVPLGATEIPALTRQQTEQELRTLPAADQEERQRAKPYIGPRPRIVTRRGWGASESLREEGFVYTTKVKAAFVHHTASGNTYKCSQVSSVIRSIYRYHVKSMGWRDIGYNFLVDKCGNIYEGRAGGVAKPVKGAHTLGFNGNSMGIAVIGTFGSSKPTSAAVKAIARLTAWKLGLYGANPRGKTYLTSGGGNLYRKGKKVRLNVISGHRDGFATDCPGRQLYGKLGSARKTAARYQGR